MKGHVCATDVTRGNRARAWYAAWRWRGLAAGIGLLLGVGALRDLPETQAAGSEERAEPAKAVASIPERSRRPRPALSSRSFVVVDAATGETLLAKDAEEPRSIASITKLMSAMVYLDMDPDLSEVIEMAREDRRGARPAATRLQKGYKLTANDLLHAALIASENPAIEALVRSTGLSRPEFVGMMNRKAQELGMTHSIFFDASGLDANNTATAHDLTKMLAAAAKYPLIAQITTMTDYEAQLVGSSRRLHYYNSNRLARSSSWHVVTGKTGYISDAGYCLAVTAKTSSERELQMVFLGAPAKGSRFGDAARAAAWIEAQADEPVVSNE